MESEFESRRLAEQARALSVQHQLSTTGLKPGMKALDAGCGPGVITADMAGLVGAQGSVLGVDLHPQRLEEARAHCASLTQCSFLQGDVRKLALDSDSFDYVWCQYVIEYLRDPEVALAELLRVTRPGGRLVISEVDGLGLHNWPVPSGFEEDSRKFISAVSAAGFDFYMGRKVFHLFRRLGLEHIRVHMAPLWVVAGTADDRLVSDWRMRFTALEPIVAPAFGGKEAYWAFCQRYLALLSDPDALKYSVLLITEGQKR